MVICADSAVNEEIKEWDKYPPPILNILGCSGQLRESSDDK